MPGNICTIHFQQQTNPKQVLDEFVQLLLTITMLTLRTIYTNCYLTLNKLNGAVVPQHELCEPH